MAPRPDEVWRFLKGLARNERELPPLFRAPARLSTTEIEQSTGLTEDRLYQEQVL